MPATSSPLLNLPAELREQIWVRAVTETASPFSNSRQPIRIDQLNHGLTPAITRTCKQVRHETLHLYYQHNTFELWRPKIWLWDWQANSMCVSWLQSLGEEKRGWLREVVLLYKDDEELHYDVETELTLLGLGMRLGVLGWKTEVSEYDQQHEGLGLPMHFGRSGRQQQPRWVAYSTV